MSIVLQRSVDQTNNSKSLTSSRIRRSFRRLSFLFSLTLPLLPFHKFFLFPDYLFAFTYLILLRTHPVRPNRKPACCSATFLTSKSFDTLYWILDTIAERLPVTVSAAGQTGSLDVSVEIERSLVIMDGFRRVRRTLRMTTDSGISRRFARTRWMRSLFLIRLAVTLQPLILSAVRSA